MRSEALKKAQAKYKKKNIDYYREKNREYSKRLTFQRKTYKQALQDIKEDLNQLCDDSIRMNEGAKFLKGGYTIAIEHIRKPILDIVDKALGDKENV